MVGTLLEGIFHLYVFCLAVCSAFAVTEKLSKHYKEKGYPRWKRIPINAIPFYPFIIMYIVKIVELIKDM